MRSYLSLIPISARVHRRKNRLTLFSIIIAVFLVTGIFSMVDAMNEMEKRQTTIGHGNWHVTISGLAEAEAEEIAARADVAAASWYEVENLTMGKAASGTAGEAFQINGIRTAVCGVEPSFVTDIMYYFSEGAALESEEQIILSEDARELLGVSVGETVALDTPTGSFPFTVSGFRSNDNQWVNSNGGEESALLVKDGELGAFLSRAALARIRGEEKTGNMDPVYYIQFREHTNIRKVLAQMKEQYGLKDTDIAQNDMLMATMGLGDTATFMRVYGIAAFLFVLVVLAGVFMISGSLNSNIAERSQFFGMMRCVGASKKQVIRFVRLEALNWCKLAIPAGVLLGCMGTWGLCAYMKYGVAGEFLEMPVFQVSIIGVASGVLVGLVTVLLAAQSPAKRASRVSPIAAVSGNSGGVRQIRRAANTRVFRVETALGVHHATAAKKNIILMTCSFALSIILFLCFSVLVEFIGYLAPQKLYAPDLSIVGANYSNVVDAALLDELTGMSGIGEAYGRASASELPATFSRKTAQDTVDLVSYDQLQLSWLEKDGDLQKGSDAEAVAGESASVLTIYDMDNPLQIGDTVCIGGEELVITGMLKNSPFSNDGRTDGKIELICSRETFVRLTGERDYGIIDMHVTKDVTEEEVYAVKALAKNLGYEFLDRRGEDLGGVFVAARLAVYGFLFIIMLISAFNIVNSISMSVSARMKQYGAMRAVGMDGRQVKKMIFAEAYTYAVCGIVVGLLLGLLFSKVIYERLITAHFGAMFAWTIPWKNVGIILVLVFAAAAVSVERPARRMRRMAITDTINEL